MIGRIERNRGPVAGENDLAALSLSYGPPELNVGQVTLMAVSGGSRIKLWTTLTKGTEVSLPASWNLASESVPSTLYVEGVAPSGGVRDVQLKLSYHNGEAYHEDRVKLTVVETDLDIEEVADEDEEDPGGYLGFNNDDDNGNGSPDKDEAPVSGENDLIAIPITLRPSLNVGLLKLEASTGGMKVKVWSSPSKSYEVVLPRTVDLSSQGVPSQLYVEGVAASGAMRDVKLTLSYIYNTATLHADPVRLTVVEADLDIAGLSDAEEEDPGGDCIVNSDDDNQNGIADGEETGTVYGENELKQIYLAIRPANLNRGEVKLEATGGLGKYKLWESASKGTEVSLPRTWNLASQSPPSSLWVEGVEASDSVADIPFKLSHHLEGATIHEDRANFTVFDIGPPGGGGMLMGGGIDSVWWDPYNSPLDGNPNPGGGWRIFPGKQNPTDATARDTVKVSAQLQPEAGNRTIHFKAYDVDDPSADSPPIDDESKAADNNGGAGQFPNQQAQDSATTNSSGVAELIFTVTMRPGDNFRVVAFLSEELFAQIEAKRPDDGGRIIRKWGAQAELPSRYQTEMLTVWRKLHVEFDEMDPPGSSEKFDIVTGISTAVTSNTLTAQGSPGWEPNCLVGGVLDPDDPTAPITVNYVDELTFEVLANISNSVMIRTDYRDDGFDNDNQNGVDDPGEVYSMSSYSPGNPFAVNTDDWEWKAALNPPSSEDVLAGVNGYLDDVYILACPLPVPNGTPGFPFSRFMWNLSGTFPWVDELGSPDFWTVCVGWAYEGISRQNWNDPQNCDRFFLAGDDDPENEGLPPGNSGTLMGLTDNQSLPRERCLVYCEAIRDGGGNLNRIVTHEIGHMLKLEHAEPIEVGGQWVFDPQKNGLMGWQPQKNTFPCRQDFQAIKPPLVDWFSDYNIDDIRGNFSD